MKPGLFRHHKGGFYWVDGIATHTETGECMVSYRSLSSGEAFVRPLDSWHESVWIAGRQCQRFTRLETEDLKKAFTKETVNEQS